jgi:hypothetical protein
LTFKFQQRKPFIVKQQIVKLGFGAAIAAVIGYYPAACFLPVIAFWLLLLPIDFVTHDIAQRLPAYGYKATDLPVY